MDAVTLAPKEEVNKLHLDLKEHIVGPFTLVLAFSLLAPQGNCAKNAVDRHWPPILRSAATLSDVPPPLALPTPWLLLLPPGSGSAGVKNSMNPRTL